MSIVVINHHGIITKYGYANRHDKIGKKLSENGMDFKLISSSLRQNNQKYIHDELVKEDVINKNFKFISLKSKPKYANNISRLINYIDFTFKVRKLGFKEKPEHIIGSSVHPFTWIVGYKLAKKYNAKFHIEIRDIWPLSLYEDLNLIQRKILFQLFNKLEKKYYPLAESIIVTAPKANEYLSENYNIDKNKVYYVPHSINIKKFQNDISTNKYHKIDNYFDQKFNITYTGSLSSSEGLINLLKMAIELKDYEDIMIHIFGGGPEENQLKELIVSNKLENVKMHGYIKSDYIPYVLSKSDLLWCGLKERKAFKYGISKNKFYDYIAAQKPIIFHSNVKYSPLNNVKNAYLLKLDESTKETVLKIRNGNVKKFNSIEFLENNHSDEVISKKFLKALKHNN